ncbi:hypothetical protein, partial [Archangium sp.]|uniref:hypothetical protein n=1 Tax=Archangium sp. TaxID=1872627 RepID=UPI002ED904ED
MPPAIRGFMARMILEAARSLPADKQRRAFAAVPPELLSLIESTPRLGWVSLQENIKLSDALHQTLGDPGFRDFFAGVSDRMLAYPLLRSFFDGAIRLFGLTPQALLKWSTYAWQQAFRDCGKLVYHPRREAADRGHVQMVLEDFPSELLRTGTFPESLAGTFDLFLRQVSKKGRVDILSVAPSKGRVVYDIS